MTAFPGVEAWMSWRIALCGIQWIGAIAADVPGASASPATGDVWRPAVLLKVPQDSANIEATALLDHWRAATTSTSAGGHIALKDSHPPD